MLAQAGAVLAQVETAEIILVLVAAMAAVAGVMVRAAPLAGLAEQEVRLVVQGEVEARVIQVLVEQVGTPAQDKSG